MSRSSAKGVSFFFGCAALLIFQLHLLRNVTAAYLIVYALSFVFSLIIFSASWRTLSVRLKVASLLVMAVVFYPAWASLFGMMEGAYESDSDVLIGVSRCIFVLPIYWIIFSLPENDGLRRLCAVVAWISFIAAMTIPLQFLIGPIWWFAESSYRSGLPRYASIFGSLTAFGVVNGAAILLAYYSFRNRLAAAIVIFGVVLGSVLSLQKAALINVVLAFIFILAVKRPSVKDLFVASVIFLLGLIFTASYFNQEISTFLSSMRIFESSSGSVVTDDVSIQQSIYDRLVALPERAIMFHGASSLLLGVGPIGGAGAFGYPEVPMTHNGLVDSLLIGGIVYFLLLLGFVAFVLRGVHRFFDLSKRNFEAKIGYLCIFMVLINIPFSGLLFFTPSAAMFFAVGIRLIEFKGGYDV